MNFSEIKTHCAQTTGLDETDGNISTLLDEWINLTQQDIATVWDWSFVQEREVVRTKVDITDGTVSVNANDTAVAGSGTAFSSDEVGDFIQFEDNNDWYEISAVTDATNLTLATAYNPTTNLSGGTYTIRRRYYTLSSDVDSVYDIRIWDSPRKLRRISARSFDDAYPNPEDTGNPVDYIIWNRDSSRSKQFSLRPWPDSRINLEVRFYKRLSDISGTSNPEIDRKLDSVIIEGTLWKVYRFKRDYDGYRISKSSYEDMLANGIKSDSRKHDEHPVLETIDDDPQGRRFLRFGDQFENI